MELYELSAAGELVRLQTDKVSTAILNAAISYMDLSMASMDTWNRRGPKWRKPKKTNDYIPMMPPRCNDTTLWIKKNPGIITTHTHKIYLLAVIGYMDDRGFGLLCRQQQITEKSNYRWRVFHFHSLRPPNSLVASSLVPRLHSCLSYYQETIKLATDGHGLAIIQTELEGLGEEYARLEMQRAAIKAIRRSSDQLKRGRDITRSYITKSVRAIRRGASERDVPSGLSELS